jgi:alkaline phosphatase
MKAKKIAKTISFLFLALLPVFFTNAGDAKKQDNQARHIILIVGDGMNIEHEIAASRYLYGRDCELSFHKLPYKADVATWDVSTYKYWSAGTYDGEVTYGTGNHTNELVRLYALGAGITKFSKYEGKWYPGTRILDNTQLFHMMMEAAGQPMPSPLSLN